MEESYIHSKQNDQIKNLVKLRERKHRDRQERFIVEGLRECQHAIQAGFTIETLYHCPELYPSTAHETAIEEIHREGIVTIVRLGIEAMQKAAYREGPDGILAVGLQRSQSLSSLSLSKAPLILILEGIEKPGNLGAILRSADGAGADAVVLVDCVLDLYNPNAIRSSQGLLFALPIICIEKDALSEWLHLGGYQTIATSPDAKPVYWEIDYKQPTALFFGSESKGLTENWLKAADHCVHIPMEGQADSLNVSVATALCLYEAHRQRCLN
ncbi:MAG: TrmH family RNA methyltransferase [Coraliomargaritaceae bacterium]